MVTVKYNWGELIIIVTYDHQTGYCWSDELEWVAPVSHDPPSHTDNTDLKTWSVLKHQCGPHWEAHRPTGTSTKHKSVISAALNMWPILGLCERSIKLTFELRPQTTKSHLDKTRMSFIADINALDGVREYWSLKVSLVSWPMNLHCFRGYLRKYICSLIAAQYTAWLDKDKLGKTLTFFELQSVQCDHQKRCKLYVEACQLCQLSSQKPQLVRRIHRFHGMNP